MTSLCLVASQSHHSHDINNYINDYINDYNRFKITAIHDFTDGNSAGLGESTKIAEDDESGEDRCTAVAQGDNQGVPNDVCVEPETEIEKITSGQY